RNGVDQKTANEIFHQVAGFAEFGFCKSHAAAFALTAYHTAHLKLYYPAEFYVGLLNNQPMGFYSPAVIAGDAKRHGVAILPVDEFATRAGLKEEALRNLALVGAFDAFGEPRRALLWRARDAHRTSPSFSRRALALPTTEAPILPPLDEQERTALDYRITGIPTGAQIMTFYRED